MKNKKKVILSSIMSIALCLSLIAGSTFALFTSTTQVNVAVTAGNVNVVATIDQESLKTYSLEVPQTSGTFANGGTATFNSSSALVLNLVTPGDVAEFMMNVDNQSDVGIKYRVRMYAEGNLAPALVATATINGRDFSITQDENITLWQYVVPKGEINDIKVSVAFPDADNNNDYNSATEDYSATVTIVIDAVQGNATTEDVITNTEAFYEALANLEASGETSAVIDLQGNVEWTTGAAHGSTPFLSADAKVTELTINGNGYTITANGSGVGPIRLANGGKLIFNNVTIVDESKSYNESAWEFTYLEFAGNLEFNNCTFTSGIQLQSEDDTVLNAIFNNCTFNNTKAGEESVYAAWISDGIAEFNNCSFTGYRGLKMHEDYGSEIASVSIDGCTFTNISKKPGVAIGDLNADTVVSITNNWFINTQAGDQNNYMYESDTDTATFSFTDANNTVFNGSIEAITSASELVAFAKAVNAGESFAKKSITLDADIDLAGVEWTPIGNSTNKFQGTFDGQNHTISNLTVDMEGKSNVGLFGMTTNGAIKNLTIENAIVTGRLNVGVLAGTPYTSTYENITLKGHVEVNGMSYVGALGGKNAYANWKDITIDVDSTSYVNADSVENGTAYRTYVGGVVGFMGEGSHGMTNVTSNIDVIGSTCDVGGIVGIAHYGNNFTNVTCSGNVTINNAAEASDAEEMGGIAGVWHNGGSNVTFTDCGFTGTLTANITEGVDLSNNTMTGKAYSATGSCKLIIIINGTNTIITQDASTLDSTLKDGGNATLFDDTTFNASETKANSGYGATGLVVDGGVFDGNGNTLKVNKANGTWDCAVNMKAGTIKNMTVNGAFRGIFMGGANGDVYIDNVVIDKVCYTFNSDNGNKDYGVYVSNSTLNGWTSYSDVHKEVVFTNCTFGKGTGGYQYAFCRPYNASVFENCVFAEGFEFDTSKTSDLVFINCYYGETLITKENAATLGTNGTIFFYNGLNGITIDGYTMNDKAIVGDSAGTSYEGELFEEGLLTDALIAQNAVLIGKANITIKRTYQTVALENVTADVEGNLIVAETDNTIVLQDCNITLDEGEKLIVAINGASIGQVMMHNVYVNGELLTQETAAQYLEGVNWYEVW